MPVHAVLRPSLWILAVLLPWSCRATNTNSAAGVKDQQEGDAASVLTVNDVSILYPLSDALAAGQRESAAAIPFRPSDQGAKGVLVPAAILDRIYAAADQPSTNTELISPLNGNLLRRGLRPVGIRFDPCFPGLTAVPAASCQAQVRIVWQPGADDAAVHTLYNLGTDEFNQLLGELVKLRRAASVTDTGEALGVHPVLAQEGVQGPFSRGLTALIKRYLGADNLANVAFLTGNGGTGAWRFGAFQFKDSLITPVAIPHSPSPQDLKGFYTANPFSHGVTPFEPAQLADIPVPNFDQGGSVSTGRIAVGDSSKPSLANASSATQEQAHELFLRIENPALTTIVSNACADCHLASLQRATLEAKKPELARRNSPSRFAPTLAATQQLDLGRGSVHNFGFFNINGAAISISQRTINESILVRDWVNKKISEGSL